MSDLDETGEFDSNVQALAAARERDKANAAEKALGGDKPAAPEADGGFTRWMKNLPANIGVGLMDAVINTVDTVDSLRSEESKAATEPTPHERRMAPSDAAPPLNQLAAVGQGLEQGDFDSRAALVALRNLMAQGTGGTADAVTQGAAQFMIPFTGWMKAFQGVRAAATAPKLAQVAGKVGQAAGAEAATMATAFDPHAGRLADLVEFGKHTEGKLADVLNTLAPDDSAINAYIEYMTSREDESDAEGRFKNVVDSLAGSAVIASVLKAGAKGLRSARAFSESPITLPEIGAPEHLAAQGQKLADDALKQFPDSPHAALVNLTEQADNVLDDDLARGPLAAAAENVRQGLPDHGVTVVPSPEGHTVVVGKQPLVTFLDEKDALEAVADYRRQFGGAFETRAAKEHVKSSDANFATLHTFSRVLSANKDRPVSTHSMLSALERNLKGDTEQGAFYKELLGRLVRKKLGGTTLVSSKPGRHENSAGHFATAFNAIELYDKAFKDTKTLLHTYAHEAVHAATIHEINASPRVFSQLERLRKATQEVLEKDADAFEAEKGGRPGRPYAFTNAAEFVAEIEANPEFRKLMQKTHVEGGTAWDKYLETIAGILGIAGLVATPAGQKEFSKLMMGQKPEKEPSA